MLALQLLIVLVLLLLNGAFAMAELALVSSRRARLEERARQGSGGAAAALRLLADPAGFLATVQIGITAVAIVAGAIGGATLAERLAPWLDRLPFLAGHGEPVAIVLVVSLLTYLSLVVGELVPKRVALADPERTASFLAPSMAALSRIAAPAVWLLKVSTETLLRLLPARSGTRSSVTEDEVRALIAEGTHAGVFAPREREMIEGVLRLADRTVRNVMTPRAAIVWIDRTTTLQGAVETAVREQRTRLLVCDGSIERPLGFVHVKELLALLAAGKPLELAAGLAPPLAVHEGTSLLRLLDLFRRDRVHAALVVDEYGAVEGLVTVTDVWEPIAGELPDQEEAPLARPREDGSWLVDGRLPIDTFGEMFGTPELAEDRAFATVAGLVLDRLGHLPQVGEKVRVEGLVLEVVDMDGRRIDTLLVERDRERGQPLSAPGAGSS